MIYFYEATFFWGAETKTCVTLSSNPRGLSRSPTSAVAHLRFTCLWPGGGGVWTDQSWSLLCNAFYSCNHLYLFLTWSCSELFFSFWITAWLKLFNNTLFFFVVLIHVSMSLLFLFYSSTVVNVWRIVLTARLTPVNTQLLWLDDSNFCNFSFWRRATKKSNEMCDASLWIFTQRVWALFASSLFQIIDFETNKYISQLSQSVTFVLCQTKGIIRGGLMESGATVYLPSDSWE